MIPQSCIKIDTNKFPIIDGEKEEIINENMYGKALCLYLKEKLPRVGITVPSYCNEDWGWWLEVLDGEFSMGLCIYSNPDAKGNPDGYAILPSKQKAMKWSWSKFKKIDITTDVISVMNKVEKVLLEDPEITRVSRHDDFPY